MMNAPVGDLLIVPEGMIYPGADAVVQHPKGA